MISISTISTPISLAFCNNNSFNRSAILPSNTFRRYFGHQVRGRPHDFVRDVRHRPAVFAAQDYITAIIRPPASRGLFVRAVCPRNTAHTFVSVFVLCVRFFCLLSALDEVGVELWYKDVRNPAPVNGKPEFFCY